MATLLRRLPVPALALLLVLSCSTATAADDARSAGEFDVPFQATANYRFLVENAGATVVSDVGAALDGLKLDEPWPDDELVGFDNEPINAGSQGGAAMRQVQAIAQMLAPDLEASEDGGYVLPVFRPGSGGALAGYVRMEFVKPASVLLRPPPERRALVQTYRSTLKGDAAREADEARQRELDAAAEAEAASPWAYVEVVLERDGPPPAISFMQSTPMRLNADWPKGELESGDELVAVNDVDTSASHTNDALSAIRRAAWPKVLRWRRKKKPREDVASQLRKLQVLSPSIVAGCYPIRLATFGALPMCRRYTLSLATDIYACGKTLAAAGALYMNNTILVAKRGFCAVAAKAENALKATAAGLLVVNENHKLELISALPGVGERLASITAAMIPSASGLALLSVLTALAASAGGAEPVVVRWGDPEACEYPTHVRPPPCGAVATTEVELDAKSVERFVKTSIKNGGPRKFVFNKRKPMPRAPSIRARGEYSGTLLAFNGTAEVRVPYRLAAMGTLLPPAPMLLVARRLDGEDEGQACEKLPEALAAKANHPAALVYRGGCAFYNKVMVAQVHGASVAIIADKPKSRRLMRMPAGQEDGADAKVQIAAVMVSRASADEVVEMVRASSRPGASSSVLVKFVNTHDDCDTRKPPTCTVHVAT